MLRTRLQDGNRRKTVQFLPLRLRYGTAAFITEFDSDTALFDFNRFDIIHIMTEDIPFFG